MSLGSHGAVGHAGAPTTDPPQSSPRGRGDNVEFGAQGGKGSDVSGIDAERFVEQRVRAVVPADARVFANVRWVAPVREDGPARDGEVDLVVLLPNVGILAVETKGGPVRRDGLGRWYAGNRDLAESPFAQVETGKHVLASKIAADPRWQGAPPRMLHAVAFPDTDRDMLAGRGRDLGPDAAAELMFDRSDLADEPAARRAFDRVVRFWSGDGSRDRPIGAAAAEVICDVLEPTVTLRPLLRSELEAGERELLAPTHHQLSVLRTLRGIRRAAIVGGAGSGKTLLAAEKARSLAADGFNVLLVCFNSLLAGALGADPALAPHVASGRLSVSTFHELCRRLGTEAGVLPTTPLKPGREWFEQVLPTGLELAIPAVGGRAQAIVVDEGQDFEASWLLSLDLLLAEPGEDVFYLFHDPSQALYRPDASGVLGLAEFELPDNCRNARPIHDFAYRWYTGDLATEPLREDGREPEIVVAEAGEATLDALREVLHRLVHTERIERARIAVLSGVALEHSAVWRKRRFRGDLTLWNGSVADDGVSRGLAADAIPAQPPRTIAIDTIHRFKGLERDVVVLVELRPDDERLGILLYVGASRAKHHLVVIATPELARRLGRMEA
jgi:UvrD-like helicase C-terminal domain/Nuclease-related domain